jgi:activator of HSP90 ATPase
MKALIKKFAPLMDSQENSTTFHFRSINISEWMTNKITQALKDRKYEPVLLNVNTETFTRMKKLSIMNTVQAVFKDINENVFSLNNYSSMNKEYEDGIELKWLVDLIREYEMEAILEFGSKTLNYNCGADIKTEPKSEIEVVGVKKKGSMQMSIVFNCSAADMIGFLTQERFYGWAGAYRKEGNSIEFENIVMRDIKELNGGVSMEYKWRDWNEYSQVAIALVKMGDCVKLILNQKNVPVELVDNVKNHWNSRIFQMISRMFNCAIKPS